MALVLFPKHFSGIRFFFLYYIGKKLTFSIFNSSVSFWG